MSALGSASLALVSVQSDMVQRGLGLNAVAAIAIGEVRVGLFGQNPRVFGAEGPAVNAAVSLSSAWMQEGGETSPGLVLHPSFASFLS